MLLYSCTNIVGTLVKTFSTDGSLFMCTPVDPLFFVLPYLIKSAKVCICQVLDMFKMCIVNFCMYVILCNKIQLVCII